MDSLSETAWDVTIVGTGLHESLLALSLSRSGKKVLHVDENDFYGSEAAALSLQDAQDWVSAVNTPSTQRYSSSIFSNASITDSSASAGTSDSLLGSPRKYSLALSPQVLYAKSGLLSTLVSAKIDAQLEFLAIGNWWLCNADQERVVKVPNGREDMFADQSVDTRSKRLLVKFLRLVMNFEQEEDTWKEHADLPFATFLERQFGIAPHLQRPLGAFAMPVASLANTQTEYCIRRIARHLRSLGILGPNFAAVTPKYGGLAEVTQVACRSCAVGGATYVLGQGVKTYALQGNETGEGRVSLTLSNDERVDTARIVFGGPSRPLSMPATQALTTISRTVSVVSSNLESLFQSLGEGNPLPAGATVRVTLDDNTPPVTILVHSSDTGECPSGKSICYASLPGRLSDSHKTLEQAIDLLLTRCDGEARVLWTLRYEQKCPDELKPADVSIEQDGRIMAFPVPSSDPVFEDETLSRVKKVWEEILGPDADADGFMKFERRSGQEETEEEEQA